MQSTFYRINVKVGRRRPHHGQEVIARGNNLPSLGLHLVPFSA